MSSVLAQSSRLMLPSEALKRDFGPGDALLPGQFEPEAEAGQITTHAVLVGNIGLLLPSHEISELVENSTVCRLPNTSTWFNGIASLRGNMIPVFDLHELFDIEYRHLQRKLIVVGENETAVAFWVDDFPRQVTLDSNDAMNSAPPIPSLLRDHARDYYLEHDQIWVDWNIETFITTLGEML